MLTELFKAIGEQAKAGAGAVIHEIDERQDMLVTTPDGHTELYKSKPARRNHQADTLQTLATFAENFAEEGPAVWVSFDGVTLYISDADRRDRVRMPLELSPQMNLLARLASARQMYKQADFLTLLRIDLKDCGIPSQVIEMVRTVRFDVNDAGESTIERGKVSVGKSHRAEFHGLDKLPEMLSIRVPVWKSRVEHEETIVLFLEPQPTSQTFQLFPAASDLAALMDRAAGALYELTAAIIPDGIPVYRGRPEAPNAS